ncbi:MULTISPECIES: hypothetical protein [Leuconostoc]|nr:MULTISPECIES: hypothetical protein [Leuconostoc]USI46764.1 hypothetical protein M0D19_05085 [Leuconostoc mesenteroides]
MTLSHVINHPDQVSP